MKMTPEMLAMMKVQGTIRVRFVEMGVDDKLAGDLAAEALH